MPAGDINAAANERTLLILMIETPQAVEQADAIAAVPGFDVLLIGSGDLSTEYGIPGQGSHPKMRAAQEKVAAACRKHNKVYGIAGLSTDFAFQAELIAKGARFVMTGSEVNYFAAAARAEADKFRALPLEKS